MVQVIAVLATAFLGFYQYIVKPEKVNWTIESAFLLAIFVLTVLGAYYTFISPVRELNAFVIAVLDTHAQHLVEFAKAQGIDIRLNIAIVSVYPFQWAWPLKCVKIVWDYGMKYAPDASTTFAVSKGVAGEAYRSRRDKLVNMEISRNQDLTRWGFSKKEASVFPNFTAVWSLPVFRLGPNERPSGKICGMLNLDSTSAGAFGVLTKHLEIGKLLGKMRELLCKLNL
ncbi:MAG TPA: hypothetical protein VN670_06150 [Acidobacteriaceae bacterium]|nr:hypothetical protein [Acidobacteriaceae bacterium]